MCDRLVWDGLLQGAMTGPPDRPFPNVNNSDEMASRLRRLNMLRPRDPLAAGA